MQGLIFSIEEFSVYDGPGIRTTVFLKGCPLRCSWCHNPEGQSYNKEIVRSPNGCINCNNCINVADIVDGKIVFTDDSIKNCPMGLLRYSGENISSEQLCEKLLKNQNMLQSGGVTFSGGEPLAQSDFLLDCLTKLKGKIHTAIQTSGYCDTQTFKKVVGMADCFLFDLKLADDRLHRKYTGVSNAVILNNFSFLASSRREFVVRIPLIPTVTDSDENICGIVNLLKQNGVNYVELLPYNQMAGAKYKMLCREYRPDFDERVAVKVPERILRKNNVAFKIL